MPFLLHRALVRALGQAGRWRWPLAAFSGLAWLAFLPNAAYVMADVRHVDRICPPLYFRNCVGSAWMIMFFYAYAVLGWVGFVLAVRQMSGTVASRLRPVWSWAFTAALMPLSALGVLLGLFDRLNSWDVFVRPLLVLERAFLYFTDWEKGKNLILYTVFLAFLYLSGKVFIDDKIINPKTQIPNPK
jgi:uncharacterized membrane protein